MREDLARGTKELVDAGLLEITEHVYSSHGEPRRRNVYKLRVERLAAFDPGEVPTGGEVLVDFDSLAP